MLNIRDQVLKKGEIIPLKYDFVFTSIFNDKNNMDIIEGFISSYLGIEVEKIRGKIKILGKDLPIDNKKEASNKVDLVLEYENKIINIEISNEMTKGIVERNIAYISKIHGRNVKYRMRDYNKIKNSLQINLDNNSIKFLIGEKFIDKYYLMNEEGKKLTEKIEIDYINMEKSNEISYNEKEEEIKRWCRVLLSKTKKELDNNLKEIRSMGKESKEKLSRLAEEISEDDDALGMFIEVDRRKAEHNTIINDLMEEHKEKINDLMKEHEKAMKDLEEEKAKLYNEKNEIVRKLLKQNIDINIISNTVGLSIEEINNLK